MAKKSFGLNSSLGFITSTLILSMVAGCASPSTAVPLLIPSATLSETSTPTITPPPPTLTPSPTSTISPTPTVTRKWPLTIVFYGDSLLDIGEVGDEAAWSFSFVDDLREMLDPAYNLITANYGGRTTTWAVENLDDAVLSFQPDSVTLWWGFNDLLGCGGFFSRKTNKLIQANLDNLIERHIQNLRTQTDTLLGLGKSVVILTTMPIDGKLPWSHIDGNGKLVWEWNYLCDYNIGLGQLAMEQRALVEAYAAEGKSVFLVDVWQLFTDYADSNGMYLDLMHPGFIGADLIARDWVRVFAQTGEIVKLKGE